MPCHHKFRNDLQLQYVDWKVKSLFIGTFNPGWEECVNNNAQWFYGRTQRNEFWCILPTIHENTSLLAGNRDTWIEFCRKNSIGITDILSTIINADHLNINHREIICGFKDERLVDFEVTITDIPAILETHPEIKQICITRQNPLPEFWKECFIDLFQYIENHPERELKIKYLRSPSRGARKGVVGNFCRYVANRWLRQGYLTNP